MSALKCTPLCFVFLSGFFLMFSSCNQKGLDDFETLSRKDVPPVEIATEYCLVPSCITLLVVNPSDPFYYDDEENYLVHWYKDGQLFRAGHRIDCVPNGHYRAEVKFINQGTMSIVEFEFANVIDE